MNRGLEAISSRIERRSARMAVTSAQTQLQTRTQRLLIGAPGAVSTS